MATKLIKIDTLLKRIALLAAALACVVGAIFIARWCAGNAIASHTIFPEIAALAVSLAPGDPQTHYTTAVLLERNFTPDDFAKSIAEYEQAAALSPNDYRTWLALGKARSRGGEDAVGAESALKKSLELAPNYSEVRWVLGNFLLREGKTEEAFVHLRKAAESDSQKYAGPAISTAWQMFDGDSARIKNYLGDSAAINIAFITYLGRENRIDDALKIWDSLPVEEKKIAYGEIGASFFNQLIAAKRYRDAARVGAEIGSAGAGADAFAAGQIFNGGFEKDIKIQSAGVFEWQIQDGAQPQVAVDNANKHGGERSLAMVFNSPTGRDFRTVSQVVPVDSAQKYVFEVFYKSELKTAAPVFWEIADASDGKILAALPAINPVSPVWTSQKTEFTVPEKSEAVFIRLVREPCKLTLCPTSGRVWFDDLTLTR